MFCSKCGNEISSDDAFCNKCGAKINNESNNNPEVSGVSIEKPSAQNVVYQNSTSSTYQPTWNYQVNKKNENKTAFIVLTTIFGILSMVMIIIGFISSFRIEEEIIIYFYIYFFLFLIPLVFVVDAFKNIFELKATKIVFMSILNATLVISIIISFIDFLDDVNRKNNYLNSKYYNSFHYYYDELLLEFILVALFILILIIFISFNISYMVSKSKKIKTISLIVSIVTMFLNILFFITLSIINENIYILTGSIVLEIYLLTILFGNLSCNKNKTLYYQKK